MAKTGRNDRCPCGSGKKYKQCCLAKDEAAARPASPPPETTPSRRYARAAALADYAAADELTEASNAVVDMVHAGQLDEAERAARQLLERFPEVHDGYDRLGMVHEARGDNRKAADYYRKVIAFVREHPEIYEPEFEDTFHRLTVGGPPDNNRRRLLGRVKASTRCARGPSLTRPPLPAIRDTGRLRGMALAASPRNGCRPSSSFGEGPTAQPSPSVIKLPRLQPQFARAG